MVKPVNACGSRGVFKAQDWSDVKAGLRATLAENFAYDGIIMEEFMVGQELGGGVMFRAKQVFVPSITSKYVDDNYIPIANILPGSIKGKHLTDLNDMLEKIAHHFDIGDNYLNVNLILTDEGPRILELGANTGNSSPEITRLFVLELTLTNTFSIILLCWSLSIFKRPELNIQPLYWGVIQDIWLCFKNLFI